MADNTDNAPKTEVADAALLTPFEFDLGVAASLGARAEGAEVVTLQAPDGIPGLPAAVPVMLKRGAQPAVEGLHQLFEPYRLHPQRKRGIAEAQTFEAFCALTNRHKTEHSAIFADTSWRNPAFTTVIDYHDITNGGRADFGAHRICYSFPLSDEWNAWIENDGQPMKQDAFAWFLEDRAPELSAPTDHERAALEQQFATTIATPAQVVELSRGLAVNVDTRVKASKTLQSGEGQIQWEEAHNGADGQPLKVPGLFILNIAPFFMGDPVRIPVRLRYRVSRSEVSWFYQIYRPDLHITEHVRRTLADARVATDLPSFEGKPEMGA